MTTAPTFERDFYRELLVENPSLLARIVAFNRGDAPSSRVRLADELTEANPNVDWAALLVRHPDLCALAAERTEPEEKAADLDYWGFAETSERFALFPEEDLERLLLRAAAAVYGAEIAVTLKKDEREAVRAKIGDELLHYAVLRGRWQAGSLAADLKRFCAGLPLPDAVERLSHLLALLLWADWPEGLREKTALRFAPHREALGETHEDAQLGRRVRAFLLKLIKSEGDEACRNLFR